MTEVREKLPRLHILDALRGFCILLMIAHHVGYDLISLRVMPSWVLDNALLAVLHPLFAGLFIALSGTSSRFSKSNLKRGLFMAAIAVGITVVTNFAGMPIYFGIIHFLAVSTLLYAFVGRFVQRIPSYLQPILFFGLFLVCYFVFPVSNGPGWLFWMGIGQGPLSYDYFPLLPWFPLYLLGTWFGGIVQSRRLPDWFYRFNMPVLPWIGRQSLIIYLAHQPLLFGLWYVLGITG